MKAFYNDFDSYSSQWLANLTKNKLLPGGTVSSQSIEDIKPDDLSPYNRCHFFAGIGAFPLSLKRLGWPEDLTVWTGGCPCQPFAAPGKRKGFTDERHLWPSWFHLIKEQRPSVVIGEQVSTKDADPWLDLVQSDLEGVGYTFGCVSFPAAGVGAPHIRERTYWVGYTDDERLQRHQGVLDFRKEPRWFRASETGSASETGVPHRHTAPGATNGQWSNADWLRCNDNKWRPVQPGTCPLADGVPGRVGRLRAYGNTVCVGSATLFVEIIMDTLRIYSYIEEEQ